MADQEQPKHSTSGEVEAKRPRGQRDPGAVGRTAEEAVMKYLTQIGQFAEDVRAVSSYQRRDIDFIRKDLQTVEVKGDTWLHKTGNLFFEVTRDHGFAGCFFRSKADYWYYTDTETGDCYTFRLSEAQAWLVRNSDTDVAVWTETRSHRRSGGVSGFVTFGGYKVNLAAFMAGVKTETLRLGVG